MAKITGAKEHLARLRRMRSPAVKAAVYRGLYAGADVISTEARHSITEGSVSGKHHVPSKPGEPPNADTHQLDTSIHVEGDKLKLMTLAVADAPHAAPLEVGSSRMEPRPYMKPATKKKGKEAALFVAKFLKQFLRGR